MQPAEDDTDRRSAIGKAIVIRRTELGLSRNDLRDRTGLSYPYVAELEKGAKRMSAASLDAVSGALELRPAELLAMADALADDTSDFPPTTREAAPKAAEPAPPPAPVTLASPVAPAASGVARRVSVTAVPDESSGWFRARKAKQATRERIAELREEGMAMRKAEAQAEAEAVADADADEPAPADTPEEARIRAIVRDELRKAGVEPAE